MVRDTDYLHDLLQPLGRIRLRRLFGGYGIYADELCFALLIGGQLYFKTDALTRPHFETAGLEEWIYEKNDKRLHMNYFRPPEAVFDEEDVLLLWGQLALAAARRARPPVKKPAGVKAAARKPASGKNIPKKSSPVKSAAKSTAQNPVSTTGAVRKSGTRPGSGTPHE